MDQKYMEVQKVALETEIAFKSSFQDCDSKKYNSFSTNQTVLKNQLK